MQRRLFGAVLAAVLLGAAPGPAAGQENGPSPLPADVVAAWQKAGAQSGWMGHKSSFHVDDKGKAGEVAGFRWAQWQTGIVGQLPAPAQVFGLDFTRTPELNDAALKEFAGLKRLQSLDLSGTQVTGMGLKELAGLKQLQMLVLINTQVTDAGLKELDGLKQLQSLSLTNTRVTDAGMAELRKALPGCRIGR